MSFREKSAWITLIAILIVAAGYMTHGMFWGLNPPANPRWLEALIGVTVIFVAIEIVGHVVLAVRYPKDARTPKDERERLIDLRAERVAAYVYVVGSLIAISTVHLGANRIAIVNAVLLAFILAEIVNYSARIVFHRRGV